MEKRAVIAILTIAAFILSQKSAEFLKLFDWFTGMELEARRTVYKLIFYVAFPLVILIFFHGLKNLVGAAGLSPSKVKYGMGTAFFGTLPMLLGAGFLVNFKMTIDLSAILVGCLLAAVGEELLYRALLFGQLFQHARWGFLVAGLASAVFFGAGHLYQGEGLASLAGVFLVTFLGGMWFSWLYVEYGYNLWVPMGYHFFMNLSWIIFDVSDTALGSIVPNIFRALTIALSIWQTIRHKRKTGEEWVVQGRRWWFGEQAENVQAEPKTTPSGKANVLAAVLVLVSFSVFGQTDRPLTGRVTGENGEALPYVNIGIVGTEVGTVSGTDGSFALYLTTAVSGKDTLRFSMVGHEARSYSVADFFQKNQPVAVSLPVATLGLREVVVRPAFARQKSIGLERSKVNMATNWAISEKPNQNLGAEIGRKFNLPKGGAQLQSFKFYLSNNSFDTVRFRLNVYEMKKGRPGPNINPGNIIVEVVGQKSGWVSVDLSPHQLFSETDVVVAVEWVYHSTVGRSLSIPLAMPSGGIHFYKYGSQSHWKKFPGMSAAMQLVVGY